MTALILPCGCRSDLDPEWGVRRAVAKCSWHYDRGHRPPNWGGQAYYESLGIVKDGVLQETKHVEEMREALGEFPDGCGSPALEVGCGVSPYVWSLINRNYGYLGIEPDEWAADFTTKHYRVPVLRSIFEGTIRGVAHFDLILAAHVLEHVQHAPSTLQEMHRLLTPGGYLYVLVPDDSDLANPDHLWFFNTDTLRATLERIEFISVQIVTMKIVAHENYLYCKARKRC